MSRVNKNRVKKLGSPSESILSLQPAGDVSMEGKKKKSRITGRSSDVPHLDLKGARLNVPLWISRAPSIFSHPLFFCLPPLTTGCTSWLQQRAAHWSTAGVAAFIQMYKDCRKTMHYTDTFTLAGTIPGLLLRDGFENSEWMTDEESLRCSSLCGGTGTIKKKCPGSWKRHWIKSVWDQISHSFSLDTPFTPSGSRCAQITG